MKSRKKAQAMRDSIHMTVTAEAARSAPARLPRWLPPRADAGVCPDLRAVRCCPSAPSAERLVARLPLFASRESSDSACT